MATDVFLYHACLPLSKFSRISVIAIGDYLCYNKMITALLATAALGCFATAVQGNQPCNISATKTIYPLQTGAAGSVNFPLGIMNPLRCKSKLIFNNTKMRNFYFTSTDFVLHFLKVGGTDFGNYTLNATDNGSCEVYYFEVTEKVPSPLDVFLQFYIWPAVSGAVFLLVVAVVVGVACWKTRRQETKIEELLCLLQARAEQMKYIEKMSDVEQADIDPNITAIMTSQPPANQEERRHHLEVQSTPSYPPPSPPAHVRQNRKSPAKRPVSSHLYDECSPVAERPPFPLPKEAQKNPDNPMYDAVAPDQYPSRPNRFLRSVRSLVRGNSTRKFGQQITKTYNNFNANIPKFKVVSHAGRGATLPNYDAVEGSTTSGV